MGNKLSSGSGVARHLQQIILKQLFNIDAVPIVRWSTQNNNRKMISRE